MQRLCCFLVLCATAIVVAAPPAGAVPVDAVTFVAGAGSAAQAWTGRGQVAGITVPGREPALPYDGGPMADLNGLNDLVDRAAGWEITHAAAIDDAGRIAAGACKDGPCHAARPGHVPAVPEPSVLALLGGGLALLGWRRRQAWAFTPLAPRCPG